MCVGASLAKQLLCPLKKEVEEVIFSVVLWNSIPSSVSKEDVTHDGFATMQLDGEAHSCGCCHRDAPARGLLSREAASIPLPSPVPFRLCSSLSPSPRNVD